MKNPAILPVAAACGLLSLASASGDLLLYEGFNGYTSGALAGKTPVNTTGLDTSVTITNGGNAPAANEFNAAGLSFGRLLVSGGSGRFNSPNGSSNAQTYIGYTYTGPTVTGTFYTSYLARIEATQSSNSIVSLRCNGTSVGTLGGSGSSYFVSMADYQSGVGPGNQYDASSGTTGSSAALALNTTYLVIGRYTEVGSTLSANVPGKGTTFILTADQLDYFRHEGFTDAELDAAPVGPDPGSIFARVNDAEVTSSVTTSYPGGFNRFASGNGIQFAIGNAGTGNPQTAGYDEMRAGTTLEDVLPLNNDPEPDPVAVSLSVENATATEPTAASPVTGSFLVQRTDASTRQVTVRLSFAGTATLGTDYSLPAFATIPENAPSVSVPLQPFADRTVEADETVVITAIASPGYTIGAQNGATITIQDGPPPVGTQLIQNLASGIPQKIVVYGTSLTAGGAWSGQMKAALDAAYPGLVTLQNTTGSGRNSKWGLANLSSEVTSKAPNTVFIEFAVNDAFSNPTYQDLITPSQARANLNAIIDGILSALPNCEIILQVMNPVINSSSNPTAATLRPNLALCQQTYRDVGLERGLLVIDHMPAWQGLLDGGDAAYFGFVSDGLHPGAPGYQQYVTPVILRSIGAPNNLAIGTVMLHADNHRAAEPLNTAGTPRRTKITVTRAGPITDPLSVPLTYGGTGTNGTDYAILPASVVIPAGLDSASIEMIPASDTAVEGEETFTVRIGSSVDFTLASPNKASLLIEDRPFDHWRKSQFSAGDLLDPLISGDKADPDHDGIENLLEFFIGRAPKTSDATAAFVRGTEAISGSDYLTLTFDRLPATGLSGVVQTSTDLTDWHDGATFIEESILSDTGLIQRVKARSLAPIGSGKEFIRLKATRAP